MQMSKSNKILTTIFLTLVAIVCVAFGTAFAPKVSAAESTVNPEAYVIFSDVTEKKMQDSAIVATVKNQSAITFKNELVVSDLELVFDIPAGTSVKVCVVADSYYVNGNKKVDGTEVTFEKKITTEIVVDGVDGQEVLVLGVEDNLLTANGVKVENDAYYKLNNVNGITVGDVSFAFEFSDDTTVEFKLFSVDQKASDATDAYKQTFELSDDGKALKTDAVPRAVLPASFYTQTEKGVYVAKRMVSKGGNYESISATIYSVTGKVKNSDVHITGDKVKGAYGVDADEATIALESGTSRPKKIAFIKEGNVDFNLSINRNGSVVVCETINVVVYNESAINNAPYYSNDALALEAFKAALKENYTDKEEGTSVQLGSTLEIPSMEDFIFDDITPYDKLALTVYYKNRIESSASKLEFTLTQPGEYLFFVVFSDQSGNAMEKEDFITVDNKTQEVTYGKYADATQEGDFVFTFTINDDAGIIVKPAVRQGTGYKGVSYTASKFTIEAEGCTLTYKLYYNPVKNANANADGWIEIPKAASIADKDYNKDGLNYETVKSIGYDGKLTFTPNKTGSYMIECIATSDISPRTASAKSIIIVEEKKQEVKPDTKWVENNALSLVFLGIGGLCLAGVIVLLFVKPKEENE